MTVDASSSTCVSTESVDEGIPPVGSAGSCVISVTSQNDAGSVGSNSTKTRFSFYNAQEVQLDEQQLQIQNSPSPPSRPRHSTASTKISADGPSPIQAKESNTTKSIVEKEDGSSDAATETSAEAAKVSSSYITSEHQRFNFYVASEEVLSSINDRNNKMEDDRRSPHSLLAKDDEDKSNNTRTPAVATNALELLVNKQNHVSPSASSSPIALSATQASRPQQSSTDNHAVFMNGNTKQENLETRKKQRAAQAAAFRARIIEGKDGSSSPEDDGNNDGNLDSVEILRSLKDTEQMRYNLLKECNPNSNIINATNVCGSKDSSSQDTEEIYQDAETFDSDGPNAHVNYHTSFEPALPVSTDTSNNNNNHTHRVSLQRPDSRHLVSNTTNPNDSNPYEDAIREALDLLRKHRPPSPQELELLERLREEKLDSHGQHETHQHIQQQQASLGNDMNVVHGAVSGALRAKMSRDVGRAMQSRCESPRHHPDKMDARRKERQERMARYTTRLAELKRSEQTYGPTSTNSGALETSSSEQLPAATDNAAAGASASSPLSSQQRLSLSALAGYPQQVAATCPSEDLASLGTASSLSASHCNPPGVSASDSNEVHRSVERVLLAILERGHSSGRAAQPSSLHAGDAHTSLSSQQQPVLDPPPDASFESGEEEKSVAQDRRMSDGNVDSHTSVASTTTMSSQENDPLLRAMGELLSTRGVSRSSSVMSGSSPLPQPTGQSSTANWVGERRSVVEELLAEAESFVASDALCTHHSHYQSHPGSTSSSQSLNENTRKAADLLNGSAGVEAVRSDKYVSAVVVDRELDELVLKTLGKSASSKQKQRPLESCTNEEDEAGESGDDDGRRYIAPPHSRSRSRSYDCDDEDTYDDDDSHDESDEDIEEEFEGVLGPLSKKAGGTTGVVLESNLRASSPDRSASERSIFDSLSNAMSSLVASAISADERQALPSNSKTSTRDKYATNMDAQEHESDSDDGEHSNSSSSTSVDEEASELMRSLCAHLLPFGVDQSSRLLDEAPQWEDSNPNEAGYRIIRLTSQQLHRVEHAFEAMVHGLKKNSEHNLIGCSQQEVNKVAIDATFERDLAAAEKALDREEQDKTKATWKALNLVPAENSGDGNIAVVPMSEPNDGDKAYVSVDESRTNRVDEGHSDFPSVHAAGRGEMGDLEFFQLPVIFKSHVTGFEPTKDLFLEPGNVVAGQYLVESELGSAAFSTAYRCIDLSSEGDDTEDGHQEVCLKVIKNTKDFFDQSLDEIKILELLRQTGQCHAHNIIEMKTFFYHREHLIIVTELLRQNLFEFAKFISDHDEEPYFTLPRLGYITRQCLIALRFVHKLGLVHSDVKPENILLGSYSLAQVKLIDFGSSCYLTDRQSSYIQSRSYRAPEVVLGLPYDGKIDVWSLGCVVAEMLTGEVTFQNDSIVSMLSRIEAICGSFPRHMIAQGRQSCRFFTKCGLLFEKVSSGDDGQNMPDASEEECDDPGMAGRKGRTVFDIFQPKVTTFSARLGFAADLHDRYISGARLTKSEQKHAMFVDFVRKLLAIDPDSRPSAAEALKHPWMVYAESLTEDNIKYPPQ